MSDTDPSPAAQRDWAAMGRQVLEIEREGLACVAEALGEGFAVAVELLGACTGRVVVTGLGKSGLVGRKIAATFSSTGTPAFFLHPVEGAHGDLGSIRAEDLVLAISNSGETDELNAIVPTLKRLGTRVLALTGDGDSTLASLADAVISTHVPREACPHNLAPTASTTATLAVGDALAVCLIELKAFEPDDFQRCHPGGALGRRLAGPVSGLMHAGELPVCGPKTPLAEALAVMTKGRLGLLAVTDGGNGHGRLLGVLSDGDVRRLLTSGMPDLAGPVELVMVRGPKAIAIDESAALAMDLMESAQITVLPVLDADGRLKGMIHLHDLLGKGRLKFSGR